MRIVFVGNADNVNLQLCDWFRKLGVDAEIYTANTEDRGSISLYFPDFHNKSFNWIKESYFDGKKLVNFLLFPSEVSKFINSNYDLAFLSGSAGLLAANGIRIPKVLIPVGYEIQYWCSKKNFPIRSILQNPKAYLWERFYRFFSQNALKQIDLILDSFEYHYPIYKTIGVYNKVDPLCIGADVQKIRSLKNNSLLVKLSKEHTSNTRIFLWFTRLQFRNPDSHLYKGPELFVRALENFEPQLRSGGLAVYMGKHGIEVEDFLRYTRQFKVFPHIRWVDHLIYSDLVTYLSMPNATLFTDFGHVNKGISGIGRDGYAVGIPMVNSTTDEVMKGQYGAAGPRLYASNVEEISSAMKEIINMTKEDFQDFRNKTLNFGDEYLDYNSYVRRLANLMEKRLNYEIL